MLTPDIIKAEFDYDPKDGSLRRVYATKGYPPGRKITRKNDQGYLITTFQGKTYRVQQLIWMLHHGTFVKELDHINRVRDDNRIENLRVPTRTQNCANSKAKSPGYKGVTFCKSTGRWKAQIMVNYVNKNLGRFDTPDEAALTYNMAALTHFGVYAYLNEVPHAND